MEVINDSTVGISQEEISDEKKEYEIAFILKAEDSYVVKQAINSRGFSILNESPVNKIRLAYPIKKEQQAYWGYCGFAGLPAEIKELSADLKLKPEVLRFLIVSLPKKSALRQERRVAARIYSFKPSEKNEKSEKPAHESKVLSNEALEKTLEEIRA